MAAAVIKPLCTLVRLAALAILTGELVLHTGGIQDRMELRPHITSWMPSRGFFLCQLHKVISICSGFKTPGCPFPIDQIDQLLFFTGQERSAWGYPLLGRDRL